MKRSGWEHYKHRILARLLDLEMWGSVGLMESIWHITARQTPRGDIGKMPNQGIAACIGWKGDADKLVNALVASGFVDEHPEHRLVIHDWHDHMDGDTRRLLRRRKESPVSGHVQAEPGE